MKKILILLICLMLFSCEVSQDSDAKQQAQQEKILQEATAQTGMPAIKNFQERKLLKMILELRDQSNLINYCYLWNEYNGKLVYLGRCLGFGLPYATQYTSPEKEVYHNGRWGDMPQADPNGLFMPSSAEGTWIMLLDSKGTPHPVYVEPRCIVSPFELDLK